MKLPDACATTYKMREGASCSARLRANFRIISLLLVLFEGEGVVHDDDDIQVKCDA